MPSGGRRTMPRLGQRVEHPRLKRRVAIRCKKLSRGLGIGERPACSQSAARSTRGSPASANAAGDAFSISGSASSSASAPAPLELCQQHLGRVAAEEAQALGRIGVRGSSERSASAACRRSPPRRPDQREHLTHPGPARQRLVPPDAPLLGARVSRAASSRWAAFSADCPSLRNASAPSVHRRACSSCGARLPAARFSARQPPPRAGGCGSASAAVSTPRHGLSNAKNSNYLLPPEKTGSGQLLQRGRRLRTAHRPELVKSERLGEDAAQSSASRASGARRAEDPRSHLRPYGTSRSTAR